jgi:hypothetical protein
LKNEQQKKINKIKQFANNQNMWGEKKSKARERRGNIREEK